MEVFLLIFLVIIGIILRTTGLNEVINKAGLAEEATYFFIFAFFALGWWFILRISKNKKSK